MFRRPVTAAGAVIAVLLSVLAGAPSPATAAQPATAAATLLPAAAQTVPDADPFYAVPADIAASRPGAVIRSRTVQVPVTSGVVGAASAHQVLYRTVDNHNAPTATVATVLLPALPWLGGGPRPLLAYQAAEDGLATTCAPSYLLASGDPTFVFETSNVTLALAQGWTVVLADYEGPNSEFLGATGEPRAVLDAVRATLAFPAAGVAPGAPIGLWGSSGGAFATTLAAQIHSSYAPELKIGAVATGALPADLNAALATLAGNSTAPLIPLLLGGFARSYPDAHIEQYLNAAGRAQLAAVDGQCINGAQGAGSQVASLASIEAYPGSLTGGAFHDLLQSLSPVGVAGVPTVPVYDYHGLIDQVAPLSADRTLERSYCTAGVGVTHVEFVAEHTTSILLGAPGALAFLRLRFGGVAVPTNCALIPAG